MTGKEDRLEFILSKLNDKKIEKVVLENISKLPEYVKNGDIEKTLTNLGDKEIEKLYLEVEKVK